MKYKVGDKVRVRTDLVDCKNYGEINYVSDMDEWKGKVVTISFVGNDNYYEIEEDTEKWAWSDEMFENVDKNKKYKIGDKVRVRNNLFVNEQYGNGVWFRNDMARYEGQVVTISKVENRDTCYRIKEDTRKYKWGWVDEMFEDVVETKNKNKKYKIGDKVKVREDLVVSEVYGKQRFVFKMEKFKGKIVTIRDYVGEFYLIEEDDDNWYWSDEMFKDVSDMDNSKVFHDAFVEMIDFVKEHLTKEQFNEFIYTIYTRGIENAPIIETPVYENIEYDGRVLWKRIKSVEYEIECKNFKDDKIKDYEIRGTK